MNLDVLSTPGHALIRRTPDPADGRSSRIALTVESRP